MDKMQSLQKVVLGQLDRYMEKNETRTFFNTIHKINSNWNSNLYVRSEAIQLLEEHIGKILFDIYCSNDFLSSKAKEAKGKKKWDLIRLKRCFLNFFYKKRKSSAI